MAIAARSVLIDSSLDTLSRIICLADLTPSSALTLDCGYDAEDIR